LDNLEQKPTQKKDNVEVQEMRDRIMDVSNFSNLYVVTSVQEVVVQEPDLANGTSNGTSNASQS
jgi:hypothetical protein